MIVVGPGIPPQMRDFAQQVADAIGQLQQPGAPGPLWAHPTAATLQATAPAASHPLCAAIVEDINAIAVSTKVAGTWTWRRADGTAL